MSFKNKVVLVTGGSSGIGAATAELFCKEGADVIIVGRNETKLRNVAEICSSKGTAPYTITADVSKDEDLAIIIKKTIERYEKLDVVVNNAGITKFTHLMDEEFISKFDEVLRTNLRSAAILTKLATPHLIKTKGSIINMSSILSKILNKTQMVYGIAKAGLDYLTKASAMELSQYGVRVNSVNPGFTRTPILDSTGGSITWDMLGAFTPLRKVAEPEEIAEMVLYLASDKARSITGSSIVIDNGSCLGDNDRNEQNDP